MVHADDHGEIADLKKRVAELEEQNRRILQLLTEIKTKGTDTGTPQAPQAAVTAAKPPAPNAGESVAIGAGNRLKFYGWLRMDADLDSQRPNNGETPLYITSPGSHSDNQGLTSFHPRLTRFGLDLNGPRIDSFDGALLTGKLETDFENGGSESRQIIRIRQAYLQLKWGSSFSFLAGQAWDIFSPLAPTVNNDTLMWNAGNLGDRRPQFQANWQLKTESGTWSIATAAGFTGAVDALDLDNNTYLDSQESGLPDVQARVGYARRVFGRDLGFGISTFSGWLNTSRPVAGRTSFRSQATNIDYTLPFSGKVWLRGEGWWGRNLSDIRGGSGQGINVASGREIRGRGGWSELSIQLARRWSIHPGFTTDNPVATDIPNGGRTRNGAFYFGNRFNPVPALTIGLDYLRWRTDYKAATTGTDNRVNLFFFYAF